MRNIFVMIAFGVLGSASALAQDEPLKSDLIAHLVQLDEESGEEIKTPTEDVIPGDIIEYELIYQNVGQSDLNGLVVTAPVPASTVFEPGSNQTGIASVFEVSLDDGVSWASPPIMIDGPTGPVEASPDLYDIVRWVPETAISVGDSWAFTYRVKVQ